MVRFRRPPSRPALGAAGRARASPAGRGGQRLPRPAALLCSCPADADTVNPPCPPRPRPRPRPHPRGGLPVGPGLGGRLASSMRAEVCGRWGGTGRSSPYEPSAPALSDPPPARPRQWGRGRRASEGDSEPSPTPPLSSHHQNTHNEVSPRPRSQSVSRRRPCCRHKPIRLSLIQMESG